MLRVVQAHAAGSGTTAATALSTAPSGRAEGEERIGKGTISLSKVSVMCIFHHTSRFLAYVLGELRNLAGDKRCAARIDRYLARCDPGAIAEPIGLGGAEAGAPVREALAQMPPLTRAVLAVVVGRRMTVAQVSRRFGISEERVCWHFRHAISMVAEHRDMS